MHASARRSTSLSILAVRNRHESLDSFSRRSNSLLRLACPSLFLPPPPPSPFPRTTVRFPLLSLLTGACFRGRSARSPAPLGPAVRAADFLVYGHSPCPPPPPPHSLVISSGSRSSFRGLVAVCCAGRDNPAPRARAWTQGYCGCYPRDQAIITAFSC